MFRGTKSRVGRAALVLAATAALGACDRNVVEPHGHHEAAGLVVTDENDVVLVTVDALRQVSGALTVQAGQARHLEVHFVDPGGDRFQLEAGDEHTLGWTVADESVAVLDAHGDHMDLDGVAAGSTTVVFRVLHGGHSDYDSPAIPITVTP